MARFVNSPDLHSPECQKSLLALLTAPSATYRSLYITLALPSFLPLLRSQSHAIRRAVAGEFVRAFLRKETRITTPSELEGVLEVIKVMIKEGSQQPAGYTGGPARRLMAAETDETIEEQGWLARLVHLLRAKDTNVQFKLLQMMRDAFAHGNERIKYTSPALLTASLKLARRYKAREHLQDDWSSQSSALYKFCHSLISTLYTRVSNPSVADVALRLFVSAATVADRCEFEDVAYEFLAQAFTVYEESISDSRAQFQAVCVFAQALSRTRNFGKENFDTLITKCALHGSRLLKKPDQCRAVYLASHLWWAVDKSSEEENEAEEGEDPADDDKDKDAKEKENKQDGKQVSHPPMQRFHDQEQHKKRFELTNCPLPGPPALSRRETRLGVLAARP